MNPYARPPPTNPLRFLVPLLAVGLVAFSLYHLAALPGPSSLSDLPAGDDNVRSPSPPQRPLPNPLPPSGLKQKLNIGTFNLRFDGQADQTPKIGDKDDGMLDRGGGGPGERPWKERRWRILDYLQFLEYDIVGFQEALHNQIQDLHALLGPATWDWAGVGRNDGKQAGEYSPIFFRTDRFDHVDTRYSWLSETPEVAGSIGWDASQTRIVTLLTLLDKSVNPPAVVHVANTHWDDQGKDARAHSGAFLRSLVPKMAQKVAKEKNLPVPSLILLLGDLNSPVDEEGYRSLTTLVNTALVPSVTATPAFLDTLHLLPKFENRGPHSAFGALNTYTGFEPTMSKPTRIDFVFLHQTSYVDQNWSVARYGVVDNFVERDGRGWTGRVSDHRAVVVGLERNMLVGGATNGTAAIANTVVAAVIKPPAGFEETEEEGGMERSVRPSGRKEKQEDSSLSP